MEKQIADNIYVMSTSQGDAIIQFQSQRDKLVQGKITSFGSIKIQEWGSDNLLPQRREKLVQENNIIPSLMQTKRDILMGAGVVPYRADFDADGKVIQEVAMPAEIAEWIDDSNFDDYLLQSFGDHQMHANTFIEFIRTRDLKKIASIHAKKARQIRLGKQSTSGRISTAYYCGNWAKARTRDFKVIPIEMRHDKSAQRKFLMHFGDPLLTFDEYYFDPSWWGGKEWIELANCIPQFHIANMNNGFNIRFHIEIPEDYFNRNKSQNQLNVSVESQLSAKKELTAAKAQLMDRLNTWLAKPKNAGRAFFSTYRMTGKDGKMFGGIKITPIVYDMKDEALIKLFDKSNEANMSSQGVHPTLANIQTQGKLSSGSEIRNAFLMYLAIKTPVPRRMILKPLHLVRKINGWDEKYPQVHGFMFKDIEITNLDESKSGKKEMTTDNGQQ